MFSKETAPRASVLVPQSLRSVRTEENLKFGVAARLSCDRTMYSLPFSRPMACGCGDLHDVVPMTGS